MNKKVLLPLVLLVVGMVATVVVIRSAPEIETEPPVRLAPLVEVMAAATTVLDLEVESQGEVQPRTQADLISEVAGRVVWVAPSFEDGGFFSGGDLLLRLDGRDYEVFLASAEAQLAQARVRLVREQAEAEVALEEWQDLGEGEAGPLVLREPQLAEARANVQAAEATVAKARLDLERTEIRAPFDGRLREKRADVGQFVNRGAPLAQIYSVDFAEIRLPVSSDDLAFLDLPLNGRADDRDWPPVRIEADFAGRLRKWEGRLVRAEGEIDFNSRMVYLVARVEDPYGTRRRRDEGAMPLAVGMFVHAYIRGRTVEDVVVVPRSAMRSDDTLAIEEASRLRLRQVEVLRRGEDHVVIGSGVTAGEHVCVSPLDGFVEGMEVRTSPVESSGLGDSMTWSADR